MFTRRTATVTMLRARRFDRGAFSSRLLYLPVPTISRDVNVRPRRCALRLDVLLRRHSTASNEMHDFDDRRRPQRQTSPNVERGTIFQVAFDRDPQTGQGQARSPSRRMLMPPGTAVLAVTRIPRLPSRLIRPRHRSGAKSRQVGSGWTDAASSDRALRQADNGSTMAPPKDPAGSGDKGAMRIDPALVRACATAHRHRIDRDRDRGRRSPDQGKARGTRLDRVCRHGEQISLPAPALSAPPMHAKEDFGEPAREEVAGESIKSPMVGTVYLVARARRQAFVKVGEPA